MNLIKFTKKKILKKRKKIKGFLDGIDRQYVFGWAWDPENPDKRLEVVVYVDGEQVIVGVANQYREDLEKAGIGDGGHAFWIELPKEKIKKRGFVEVSVKIKDINIELNNSPQKFYFRDFGEESENYKMDLKQEINNLISFLKLLKEGVNLFHIVIKNSPLKSKKTEPLTFISDNLNFKIENYYLFDNIIVIPFFGLLWRSYNETQNKFLFKIKLTSGEMNFSISTNEIIRWFKYIFIYNLNNVPIYSYFKQYLVIHCIEAYINSDIIRNEVHKDKILIEKIFESIEPLGLSEEILYPEEFIDVLKPSTDSIENKVFNEIYKKFINNYLKQKNLAFISLLNNKKSLIEEKLVTSLIPSFCLKIDFEFYKDKIKLNKFKDIPNKTSISLSLIATNDLIEATNLIYKLADPKIPGWISTECIYYFILNSVVKKINYIEDIKKLDDVIYALICLLNSFNDKDRLFSRIYDRYLIYSYINLIKIISYLSEWTQKDLTMCLIRNYGLVPEFWQHISNSQIETSLELLKARENFEIIQSILETNNFTNENIEKLIMATKFFLNLNNSDAIFLLREIGYILINVENKERAKLLFEELNQIKKGEILRYFAHPNSEPPNSKAEQYYLKGLIRELIDEVPKNSQVLIESKFGEAILKNDEETIKELFPYLITHSKNNLYVAFPFVLRFYSEVDLIGSCIDLLDMKTVIPPSLEAMINKILVDNDLDKKKLIQNILDLSQFEWLNIPNNYLFNMDEYHPYFKDTLFVIYSCQKNLKTRIKKVRESYLKDLQKYKIPYLIIVGGAKEDYIDGDILYLNVSDNYESLPKKTIKFLQWLYENSPFYYVYKIDDDSYIDIEKFLTTLQYRKYHYFGTLIKGRINIDRMWHISKTDNLLYKNSLDKSNFNLIYADGGSGYSLSRYAIYKILENLGTKEGQFIYKTCLYEDVLIGSLLSLSGIIPASSEYFVSKQFKTPSSGLPVHKWHNYFYPSKSNPIIYIHLDTEKSLQKAQTIKESSKLYPHKIFNSSIDLSLNTNSNQLELITDETKFKKLICNEPIIISPVRNEREMLPHFLNYYRKLGIECFIFIDNVSDDGSTEYLYDQPDVVLFSVDTEYKESHYGIVWQHAILSNFCHGKWSLMLDVDEFLIYPDCENLKLREWLNSIEKKGFLLIRADLLDVYPKKLEDFDLTKKSPFDIELYFDKEPFIYILTGSGHYSNCQKPFSSGLRHRICPSASISDFTAVKYPIFKYYPWIRFSEGVHFITPIDKALEGEAVLLHIKYHRDFKNKVIKEVLRKQHFQGAREYYRFFIALQENAAGFYQPEISIKFENSNQLIEYLRNFYNINTEDIK